MSSAAAGSPGVDEQHPRDLLQRIVSANPRFNRPSNLASLGRLGIMALVFASCLLALSAAPVLCGPIAFVVIGVLQYHLVVAMHEAYHRGLLHPRGLNDAAGLVIAAALTFDFRTLQRNHMQHHKRYGFPDDPDRPDYELPPNISTPSRLLVEVFSRPWLRALRRVLGTPVPTLPIEGGSVPIRHRLPPIAVVHLALVLCFAVTGHVWLYFFFWLLPLLFFPGPLARLRTLGEHAGLGEAEPSLDRQHVYARSNIEDRRGPRSWPSRLEKVILGPFHFNHHHEHHLMPGVPYPWLPGLHAALKASGHYDRHPRNLGRTFMGSIREARRSADGA